MKGDGKFDKKSKECQSGHWGEAHMHFSRGLELIRLLKLMSFIFTIETYIKMNCL